MKIRILLICVVSFMLSGCTAYIFWKAAQPAMKEARAREKAAFEASGMTKKEWRNRPKWVRSEWDEEGKFWLITYDDGSTKKIVSE